MHLMTMIFVPSVLLFFAVALAYARHTQSRTAYTVMWAFAAVTTFFIGFTLLP